MSVTAAAGFRAAGVPAGLKSAGPDVALVVNDGPEYAAAGVFTANRIKAAPVLWSQQVLEAGSLRAVVLNSRGAKASTLHRTGRVPGHPRQRRVRRGAARLRRWRRCGLLHRPDR
jgi:N-acetylglutamate synthase/N-acetylornithine aminotransferase